MERSGPQHRAEIVGGGVDRVFAVLRPGDDALGELLQFIVLATERRFEMVGVAGDAL